MSLESIIAVDPSNRTAIEPFKIFDNLYYAGELSVYVFIIKTVRELFSLIQAGMRHMRITWRIA